jgi:hypothetical protein
VQVVAAVVGGVHHLRVGRVGHHRREVHDRVEGATGTDPLVDLFADPFPGLVPVAGHALERQ